MFNYLIISLLGLLLSFNGYASDWPAYGGQKGGGHYSSLTQITPDNVDKLKVAWIYHTGQVSDGSDGSQPTAFEATPILSEGVLYTCTPYNQILALNPINGKKIWLYDPKLDRKQPNSQGAFICRGVASWIDMNAPKNAVCRHRIFEVTVDGRLIGVDGKTGKLCHDFGNNGQVDLKKNFIVPITTQNYQKYGVPKSHIQGVNKALQGQAGSSSAPVVINNLVVIGLSIGDNIMANMPDGVVRAYDTRTGKLVWSWNPIPQNLREKTGAANAWGPLSVDEKNNFVLVPTSSPSPDYYGGNRLLPMPYTDAVVALNANTGKPVWHFQTIHHDLFDYDLAAQPTAVTITQNNKKIPVVIEGTKLGFVFVLNRLTGKPIFPIEERVVPASTVPGEKASPTQPIPILPEPLLSKKPITADQIWGLTYFDRKWCLSKYKQARNDGLFTPPSLKGSLIFPFVGGGINWGGVAYNPKANLLVVNFSRLAYLITLVPRDQADPTHLKKNVQYAPAYGTPYAIHREFFLSPLGIPCTAPPWGELAAIDLNTGKIRWRIPFGTVKKMGIRSFEHWGSPNMGGALTTASGLIFIGAAMDDRFRAYNIWTGQKLWETKLPAQAAATPMTYQINGKQYIVISAGGALRTFKSLLGDAIVAFTLPNQNK